MSKVIGLSVGLGVLFLVSAVGAIFGLKRRTGERGKGGLTVMQPTNVMQPKGTRGPTTIDENATTSRATSVSDTVPPA